MLTIHIDLDEFKVINDTLGHDAGDLLLKEVSKRLKNSLRVFDQVSRFGGDEFTVIIDNISKHEDVIPYAESILENISKPFEILNRDIHITASLGISLFPYDGNTIESLARKADAAMFDAKGSGKGRYSFSSEEIEKRNHEALEMKSQILNALEKGKFKLVIQPQIGKILGIDSVVGAETLIRWYNEDGTSMRPDKFIPFAENNGLIVNIGNWVIDEVFKINKILRDENIKIKLSCNISTKQFENDELLEKIKDNLYKYDELPIDLIVEITESLLFADFEKSNNTLESIRKLGVKIALDDFGTGFSSLSYLSSLPLHYLKIDKSFINDIDSLTKPNLTSDIISMSRKLGLKTVAEGVETLEQALILRDNGCDEIQGYFFSKPLEVTDFITFYKKFNINDYIDKKC